ncbi:MAG: hypothetical protein KAT28_04570 [Candidatus Aenigmarchaeota archaeon]|nr:hypothetical protein [Candidatus Aenigmarchaeota archaeon]
MLLYGDVNSKDELEIAVDKGEISVFELAVIEDEHPEFIDDELKQRVYEKEFEFFIGRLPFYKGSFTTYLSCIKDAENILKVGKKLSYNIDSSPLDEIKEQLPELAQKHAEYLIREARKNAKRFKRTRKHPVYRNLRFLENLEDLRDYGINPDDEINEILYIAYKKGVKYFIEEANKFAEDDSRKSEYLRVAERNEEYLNDLFQ